MEISVVQQLSIVEIISFCQKQSQANIIFEDLQCLRLLGSTTSCSGLPLSLVVMVQLRKY